MPGNEIYEQWRKARADVQSPSGFADRVMVAVETRDRDTRETVVSGLLVAITRSKLGRAAIFSIAATACLVRIGCLVSTFVVF